MPASVPRPPLFLCPPSLNTECCPQWHMRATMNFVIYVTVIALLVGLFVVARPRRASSLPLPPGPRPLPIIGNVHQAPKSHAWRRYLEWSKKYGPIVHVNMLGQSVIVLSSSLMAHDLLAKRGATFSDRPRLFVRAIHPMNIPIYSSVSTFDIFCAACDGAGLERPEYPSHELHGAV